MMNVSPHLARITIFPIKALPGVDRDEAFVQPSGGLAGDRQFAMLAQEGGYFNSKRTALVHKIGVEFSESDEGRLARARFSNVSSQTPWLDLEADAAALETWLSEHFRESVKWSENAATGFPDDLESPGPTIVTTATLRAVCEWFPGMALDEARRRFRANLEIDGAPAFWEDGLCASTPRKFTIGVAAFLGVNPCQRCVTPTRESASGVATPRFVATFSRERERTLPAWADRAQFDHFYRLTVNTRLANPASGGKIRVGDAVTLIAAC
jgi:uncharacterized protein YcbX